MREPFSEAQRSVSSRSGNLAAPPKKAREKTEVVLVKKKTNGFYLDFTGLRESLPALGAWFAGYCAVASGVACGILFKAFGEPAVGWSLGELDAMRGVALALFVLTAFLFGLSSLSLASDYGEARKRAKKEGVHE